MKNVRHLKIERKWRMGQWQSSNTVAQIRLQGKWLEAAGFVAGSRVQVGIENGCLTIRPLVSA